MTGDAAYLEYRTNYRGSGSVDVPFHLLRTVENALGRIRDGSFTTLAVGLFRRRYLETGSDQWPLKNSAMLGAVAAWPGNLLTPRASRARRNVLWC